MEKATWKSKWEEGIEEDIMLVLGQTRRWLNGGDVYLQSIFAH